MIRTFTFALSLAFAGQALADTNAKAVIDTARLTAAGCAFYRMGSPGPAYYRGSDDWRSQQFFYNVSSPWAGCEDQPTRPGDKNAYYVDHIRAKLECMDTFAKGEIGLVAIESRTVERTGNVATAHRFRVVELDGFRTTDTGVCIYTTDEDYLPRLQKIADEQSSVDHLRVYRTEQAPVVDGCLALAGVWTERSQRHDRTCKLEPRDL